MSSIMHGGKKRNQFLSVYKGKISEAFASLWEKEKISGGLCCQGLAVICFQYSGQCKLIFFPWREALWFLLPLKAAVNCLLGSHANGKPFFFSFFVSVTASSPVQEPLRANMGWNNCGVVCKQQSSCFHPELLCKGLILSASLAEDGGWGGSASAVTPG